jgi:TusA-related sulfurtransferase
VQKGKRNLYVKKRRQRKGRNGLRKKPMNNKIPEQRQNSLRATIRLVTLGLNSPENILKISEVSTDLKEGSTLEVIADSPTFEEDVSLWCEITKKKLLWIKDEENGKKRCHIQF